MYKVILILDKFFLKYEWGEGGGGSNWTPQEKLPSKNQALLGLKFSSNDSNESDEE